MMTLLLEQGVYTYSQKKELWKLMRFFHDSSESMIIVGVGAVVLGKQAFR
jgi:uncharacterized membrane protein YqhA